MVYVFGPLPIGGEGWDEGEIDQDLGKGWRAGGRGHRRSIARPCSHRAPAVTVFTDALAITITDPSHSREEARFIDVGLSVRGRLLVVVYTERGDNIRVISCRKATSAERKEYERAR